MIEHYKRKSSEFNWW